ncbi:MAG: SufD family Fe-S cluster assembly protein [Candidatus Bathycorpusculaceae bacterium]
MLAEEGVILMPSSEAYERLEWTRTYFDKKPEEGYFIWVKKQINHPVSTCIAISSPKVYQDMRNLVIVENNVNAYVYSICNAVKPNLHGSHTGYTKIILRENSQLNLLQFHKWGENDEVLSSTEFILEKGTILKSLYKCSTPPRKLKVESKTLQKFGSSTDLEIAVLAKNGDVEIHDSIFLKEDKSSGITKLRMVADENSRILSHSKIVAEGAGRGHVDCMALLLSANSSVNSIPELLNNNKNAVLTHEASIGKVSEEELNYLRSRGLTEDEAVNFIVTGFLGEPVVYKSSFPQKENM